MLRNERIPESVNQIPPEKDTGKEKLKQSEKDLVGQSNSGLSADSLSAQKKMLLAKGHVAVGDLLHL